MNGSKNQNLCTQPNSFGKYLFATVKSCNVGDPNRPTLPYDLVCQIDCLLDAFVGRIVECHVNFAFVLEHAKTTRWGIELADKCCRENVLPGVLLDMIEPSQPVDLAVNRFAHLRNWTLDYMDYAFIIRIQAIHDTPVVVSSGARKGLPAGSSTIPPASRRISSVQIS